MNCLANCAVAVVRQQRQIVEKNAGAIGIDALRFRPETGKVVRE